MYVSLKRHVFVRVKGTTCLSMKRKVVTFGSVMSHKNLNPSSRSELNAKAIWARLHNWKTI